jgi:hypothetical protein
MEMASISAIISPVHKNVTAAVIALLNSKDINSAENIGS